MKEIKYVPKACQGEAPQIKGFVTVKAPSFAQRMAYMSACNVEIGASGEVSMSGFGLQTVAKLVELSESHYLHVELEKADGTKISSYADMTFDSDCDEILTEVATMLLYGFKLPKK